MAARFAARRLEAEAIRDCHALCGRDPRRYRRWAGYRGPKQKLPFTLCSNGSLGNAEVLRFCLTRQSGCI